MGKFSEWFFKPLAGLIDNIDGQGIESLYPLNPVTEDNVIVPSFCKTEKKSKLYRPETFDEYIGQSRAKEILRSYMKGVKSMGKVLPHVLIHGPAGTGKTTLARILAKEMGVNFREFIVSQLSSISEDTKIDEIDGGMLFFDEVHAMPRDICEIFYPIMEDFIYEGETVKPFTMIGATTEVGEILKNRRPFYDRFKIIIELEDYTIDDLTIMASQYNEMAFSEHRLPPPLFKILAENCRGVPRGLIRLIEASIYFGGHVDRVLKNYGIIKNGHTEKDLKILKYLELNEKGVGLKGLVAYLGTSQQTYEYEVEPYLLKTGMIIRSPRGRKITGAGVNLRKELDR